MSQSDVCQVEWACQPGQQHPCFPPNKDAWTGFANSSVVVFPVLTVLTVAGGLYLYGRTPNGAVALERIWNNMPGFLRFRTLRGRGAQVVPI
jgi:hypothetical protein